MFSYKEQISIIEKIRVSEGEHKTLDCPFCGGRKKFTIDKIDGVLVWNCFRASCTAKGSLRGKRDLTALRNYVSGTPVQRPTKRKTPLPIVTTSVYKYGPAVEYLKSVNSYESYRDGLIKIRYAPADNRVLFYTPDGQGAVGRALDKRLPKWWSYGDTSGGIPVGIGNHAVLVEDVASACAISRVQNLVGYSILGTTLTKPIRDHIKIYSNVTLILDSDASSKAVSMIRKYSEVHHLRITKYDPKWLSVAEIERLVSGH